MFILPQGFDPKISEKLAADFANQWVEVRRRADGLVPFRYWRILEDIPRVAKLPTVTIEALLCFTGIIVGRTWKVTQITASTAAERR